MMKRLSMPMAGAALGVLILATAVWVVGPLLGGTGSAQDIPAVAIGLKAVDSTGLPTSSGSTGTLGSVTPPSATSTTSFTAGPDAPGGAGPQGTGPGGAGSGTAAAGRTGTTVAGSVTTSTQRTTVTERLRVYDPGAGGQHGADARKQGAGAGH